MAITGISAISGEQIIAAGAVSAKEAATASFTTGGNDIQSLYTTVSTNSASWTASGPSYTGDAQGALDEVYTNSGTWNDTTNTVNTNSGAWGGAALPISAGPGVKVELTDGKLLFSTDETVLWSGANATSITGITLNESYANFDRVRFYWNPWTDTMSWQVTDIPGFVSYINLSCGWANNSQRAFFVYEFSSTNHLNFSQVNGAFSNITSTAWTTATACKVYKVVGINRTAGGN